jgi:proteic killer suppression protein
MIGVIRHKELAALYAKGDAKSVQQKQGKRLIQILNLLATAYDIKDMRLPGLKLHKLTGDLKDFYAVSVSANWRIIFRFADGVAEDVDLVDYH